MRYFCKAAPVMTAALLAPLSASALSGADVLDKMSSDQGQGYLAGSVEMAAMISGLNDQNDRADCIMNWYYHDDGVTQLVNALDRYKDRNAQAVIYAMIKKNCGE